MRCLEDFRKDKSLSRQAMADSLGISLSLYEKIESGGRKPSRNFMGRFKRAFPSFDMNIFFDELLHEKCS